MAFRQLHLNKSGSGMASRTACGRNILRTPLSANWEGFKAEPAEHRCAKCAASKQFEVNTKMDARKAAAENTITCFETNVAGFEIKLEQRNVTGARKKVFDVTYGLEVDKDLDYYAAAAQLGRALMHAAALEGKLDQDY